MDVWIENGKLFPHLSIRSYSLRHVSWQLGWPSSNAQDFCACKSLPAETKPKGALTTWCCTDPNRAVPGKRKFSWPGLGTWMDSKRVYVLAETNWHVSFVLPWTAWAKPQHITWRFGVSCSHHFETTYVYKVYRTSQHRCFRNSGNVGWRLVPNPALIAFCRFPQSNIFHHKT